MKDKGMEDATPAPGAPDACWGSFLTGGALGWLGGLAWQLQQSDLPAVFGPVALSSPGAVGWVCGWIALGLVLLACALAWASPSAHRLSPRCLPWHPWRCGLVAAVGAACLAVGSTDGRAAARLADRLPSALEAQNLVVQGRVRGLPQVGPDGWRFVLEVEQAWTQDEAARARGLVEPGTEVRLPARLLLSWSGHPADAEPDGWAEAPAPVHAGELWRLPVRLRRPHGLMNPGGFDAELWLFEQDIGAVGAVKARWPSDAQRQAPAHSGLWDGIRHPLEVLDAWRQQVRDTLLLQPLDARAAGMLAALSVGDQGAISEADWDLFRRTGIAHLVSISGMHITMFAWLAAALIERWWRLWPRAMWFCPSVVVGRWGGVLLATVYALLSGWGIPAQRTVGMLALGCALRSWVGSWPGWAAALLAAWCVLVLDPWALLQPGFWLSFVAVLLLMRLPSVSKSEAVAEMAPKAAEEVSSRWVQGWPIQWGKALRAFWREQWVVTLGLAPLSLVMFGQVSLVGVVANAVAVPVITFVITPLSMLGVLWHPLWNLGQWALTPLLQLLTWLGAPHGVVASTPEVAWPVAAMAVLGGCLCVLPVPWRVRILGVSMMLPLCLAQPARPAPGQFELVAADVGQGSAVIIRTASHVLVHDTGPRMGSRADAGGRVLLPLLRAQGEGPLDELILSHRDADHVGGAATLLRGWPVRRLRASLEPDHPLWSQAGAQGAALETCVAGQHWQWDGVSFMVLHPFEAASVGHASNAFSCVLAVRGADGRQALLTGDIEAAQEEALLAHWGADTLHSEVLIVPHHGSHTSSSEAFIRAVAPQVAVIQVGYLSRFGHPHRDVTLRYTTLGIPMVRTDHCGAWNWQETGANCTRHARRRYWQWTLSGELGSTAGSLVARSEKSGEQQP